VIWVEQDASTPDPAGLAANTEIMSTGGTNRRHAPAWRTRVPRLGTSLRCGPVVLWEQNEKGNIRRYMTSNEPQLVVLGMTAGMPFAGMAWQVLHYLEGLRRLGYDVCDIEDTRDWPYDPEQNTIFLADALLPSAKCSGQVYVNCTLGLRALGCRVISHDKLGANGEPRVIEEAWGSRQWV
jgi:hypothetical protein